MKDGGFGFRCTKVSFKLKAICSPNALIGLRFNEGIPASNPKAFVVAGVKP